MLAMDIEDVFVTAKSVKNAFPASCPQKMLRCFDSTSMVKMRLIELK